MPDNGPMIIGLHGLANKPPPKTLAKWWHAAIVEGLRKNRGLDDPDIPFRMVYWADRLYAYPQHRRSAYTFDNLYNREPYREAAAGALKRYEEGFMDSVRHTLSTALGAGLDAVYKVAGLEVAGEFLLKRTGMLRDDLVHNDYTSPAGKANPHKSYGYLRTPEMSDAIADFLGV